MEKIASKSNIRHYIFGYGSLVCSKSRKITAPTLTKPAQPVVINHIRRTWTARIPHRGDVIREDLDHIIHGQTAMGVEMSEGHNCTGVLIEVEADELVNFDIREGGYGRVEIDLHHIFSLEDHGKESCLEDENTIDHHVLRKAHYKRKSIEPSEGETLEENDGAIDDTHVYDDVKVWVYVPKNGGNGADHNFPIMQSYVDIILRGCLSISKDFAVKYLGSTHGWSHDKSIHHQSEVPEYLWVDDRHAPYYSRADEEWSSDMKNMLDDLLKEIHPEPFERRIKLLVVPTVMRNR